MTYTDLQQDPPALIKGMLAEVFGHASDPSLMSKIVDTHEQALPIFFSRLVVPLLNTIERPDYKEVYDLFDACCAALVQKCKDHIRVRFSPHRRRLALNRAPDTGCGRIGDASQQQSVDTRRGISRIFRYRSQSSFDTSNN